MDKGRTCERRSRNHENIHLPSWKTEPPSFLKHHTFFWTPNCQKLQLCFYLLPLFYQKVLLRPQSHLQETQLCKRKKKEEEKEEKQKNNATIPSTIDGDAACVALCDYALMPVIMQGNYSIHYEPISTQLAGPCPDFFSPLTTTKQSGFLAVSQPLKLKEVQMRKSRALLSTCENFDRLAARFGQHFSC